MEWKNIEGLKLLLNVPSIDVHIVDNLGSSSLHEACQRDNIEGLKLLLDVPTIDVNILTKYDWSAVHRTCTGHSIEGLKLLLCNPSLTALTLNQKDKQYGDTPVMFAVRWKKLEHLKVLAADPRVDLDTTDKEGKSLEEVAYEEYNW